MGHAGVMRGGFDGRTVALVALALVLGMTLGTAAGSLAGGWAGALAALAGLIPPAVLAVAIERRARNLARLERKEKILDKYAPPEPAGDWDGEG